MNRLETTLTRLEPIGYALLRIVAGVLFFFHGAHPTSSVRGASGKGIFLQDCRVLLTTDTLHNGKRRILPQSLSVIDRLPRHRWSSLAACCC